jgi:hypothetical protein
MKYPFLSCLTNVNLKFTLSDIGIATAVCFQGPLAWKIFLTPFHPKPLFI